MSVIYVRAKAGRIAHNGLRGPIIPQDEYVPVRPSRYISRLIEVHGDIEVRPNTVKAAKPDADTTK